jgi:hypothetical protein
MIIRSISRREAMPARASSLAMRCGSLADLRITGSDERAGGAALPRDGRRDGFAGENFAGGDFEGGRMHGA